MSSKAKFTSLHGKKMRSESGDSRRGYEFEHPPSPLTNQAIKKASSLTPNEIRIAQIYNEMLEPQRRRWEEERKMWEGDRKTWEGDRKTWEDERKTWSTRFDQRTKVVDRYFEDNGRLTDRVSSLEELLERDDEDKKNLDNELSTLQNSSAREKEERQREREEYETAARLAEERDRKGTEAIDILHKEVSILQEALGLEETGRQVEKEESATVLRTTEEKNEKLVEETRSLKDEISTLRGVLLRNKKARQKEADRSAAAVRVAELKSQELAREKKKIKDELSTLRETMTLNKDERQVQPKGVVTAVGRIEGRFLKVTLRYKTEEVEKLNEEKKKKDEIIFALESKLKEDQGKCERQLEEKNTNSANRERALGEKIIALEVELQRSRAHVEDSYETQTISSQSLRIRELDQELGDLKAQIKDRDETYSVVLVSRNKWKERYDFRYETFCKEKESDIRAAVERTTASLESTHENDIQEAVTAAVLKVRREMKEEVKKEKEAAISEALSRENLRFSKTNAERESIANAEKHRAVLEAVSVTEEKARIERESADLQYNQSLQHKQSQITTAYQNLTSVTKSKEEAAYVLVKRSEELYNTKSQLSALTEKCHGLEQKLQDSASKTIEEFASDLEAKSKELENIKAAFLALHEKNHELEQNLQTGLSKEARGLLLKAVRVGLAHSLAVHFLLEDKGSPGRDIHAKDVLGLAMETWRATLNNEERFGVEGDFATFINPENVEGADTNMTFTNTAKSLTSELVEKSISNSAESPWFSNCHTKEHELAAEVESLKNSLQHAEADLKEKSAKIISLDAEQGSKSLQLEALRDELTSFLDSLDREKRANTFLMKTLSSREADLETKTSELRGFEQKCDSLTEASETQTEKIDGLATELSSQKALLYERGAELSQVSRTNDELTRIVSTQRDETDRLCTEMGSQKTLLDETLTKLVRASGIKDELAQTVRYQKEENARLVAEISSQKSHLDELTAMLNRVSGTADDLTQNLGDQKEENARLIVELASQKTQTTRLSSELFTKSALLEETNEKFIEVCRTRNKLLSTLECQRKISTAELSSQKALLHETSGRLAQVSNTKDEFLGQNKQLTGTINHQHAQLSTHIDRIGALTAKVQELEESNRKLLQSESQLEVQLYDLRHMEPPVSARELSAIAVKDQALMAIMDLSKTVAELQERLQRFRDEGKGSENGSGHTSGGGSVDMDAQRDHVTSTSEEQPNENTVTRTKSKLCNVRIASVVMEELDQMGENQGENNEALPQVRDLESYRYPVCDCHPELLRDLPEDNVTIMLHECARRCPYCGREAKTAEHVRRHINRSVCNPGQNILLGLQVSKHSWTPRDLPVVLETPTAEQRGQIPDAEVESVVDEEEAETIQREDNGGGFDEVNNLGFPRAKYPNIRQTPFVDRPRQVPEWRSEHVPLEEGNHEEGEEKEEEYDDDSGGEYSQDLTNKAASALELLPISTASYQQSRRNTKRSRIVSHAQSVSSSNKESDRICSPPSYPTTPSPEAYEPKDSLPISRTRGQRPNYNLKDLSARAQNKKTPGRSAKRRARETDEVEEVAIPLASRSKRIKVEEPPSLPMTRERRRVADESPAIGVKRRKRNVKPRPRLIEEYEN